MAIPCDPDHPGAPLYQRLVRVWLEKVPFFDTHPPGTTMEMHLSRVKAFAEERGYVSGDIAKVVMLSRFGDAGLTKFLTTEYGYNLRLDPESLELLSDDEERAVLAEYKRTLKPEKIVPFEGVKFVAIDSKKR
jgi:hypothetical protein